MCDHIRGRVNKIDHGARAPVCWVYQHFRCLLHLIWGSIILAESFIFLLLILASEFAESFTQVKWNLPLSAVWFCYMLRDFSEPYIGDNTCCDSVSWSAVLFLAWFKDLSGTWLEIRSVEINIYVQLLPQVPPVLFEAHLLWPGQVFHCV